MIFRILLYQQVRAAGAPTSATTMNPTGASVGQRGCASVGTTRLFEQGTVIQTNNQYDIAIEGNGFFVVQQPDGTLAYTRSGTFQTDGQGRIVSPEGLPIDPPISIPTNATGISISATGKVTANVSGETRSGRAR